MRVSADCSFDSATLSKHCNSVQVTAGNIAYIFDTNSNMPALINKHSKMEDLSDPQTYVEPGFAVSSSKRYKPKIYYDDEILYQTLVPNN